MQCTSCQHDNPPEASFCANCGAALAPAIESPSLPLLGTPASSVSVGVERLEQKRTFRYWGYSGLAVGTALFAVVVVLVGSSGFGLFLAALGAGLWVGVTGNWPGTHRRVNPVVRAILALSVIAVNAAFGAGVVAFFGDGSSAAVIGLVAFVAATAAEGVAILLVVGVIKVIRHFWQQARTGLL